MNGGLIKCVRFCIFVSLYQLHVVVNTLDAELNSVCHLLALLGAHHIPHVSGIRDKLYLVFRMKVVVA